MANIVFKRYAYGFFLSSFYGVLRSIAEADARESLPGSDSFVFRSAYKGQAFAIDSSEENDKLYGRLINHFRPPYANLVPKIIFNEQTQSPGILFFASRNIPAGSQIFYDYQDRRREVLVDHPFLKRNQHNARSIFLFVSPEQHRKRKRQEFPEVKREAEESEVKPVTAYDIHRSAIWLGR